MTIQGSREPRRQHSFQDIDEEECYTLLGSHPLGRVAFTTDEGVLVFPVNHVVYDGAIYFRTSPYSTLVNRVRYDDRVSFEVDDIDEYLRAGWSVLVMGHAELLDPHEALDTLPSTSHPDPWAAGGRTVTVRVRPTRISGRRVLPG